MCFVLRVRDSSIKIILKFVKDLLCTECTECHRSSKLFFTYEFFDQYGVYFFSCFMNPEVLRFSERNLFRINFKIYSRFFPFFFKLEYDDYL